MGGDDLDDDYLVEPIAGSPIAHADDSDENEKIGSTGGKKKRKLSETDMEQQQAKDKTKNSMAPSKILISAGKNLGEKSVEQQCRFLITALQHYSMLSGESQEDILKPSAHHFAKSSKERLLEQVKESISMKKLKKWKHVLSPSVVVVTVSARRSVHVLKQLSGLKVRAAKLFPKNGDEKSQREQLAATPFGLAVGTPHRLGLLCEGNRALNFEHTQLVVIDCHANNKSYTVATMPDTAAHVASLIKLHVLPPLHRRKDMKIAFF